MTYYLKTVYFQQICYNFVTRPVVCPMSSALTAGSYTVTRYTAVSCANNTPGVLLSACLLSNTQYPIYIYMLRNKDVHPMHGTKSASVSAM